MNFSQPRWCRVRGCLTAGSTQALTTSSTNRQNYATMPMSTTRPRPPAAQLGGVTARAPQDLCRSFEPDGRLLQCGEGQRCACSAKGCATRSDDHPLGEASSRAKKGVAINRDASYCNSEFFVAMASGIASIRPVHFKRFRQRNAQGFQQFLTRGLLAVDSGNFLNPTDPPFPVLLYYCCVVLVHLCTSGANSTPARRRGSLRSPTFTPSRAQHVPLRGENQRREPSLLPLQRRSVHRIRVEPHCSTQPRKKFQPCRRDRPRVHHRARCLASANTLSAENVSNSPRSYAATRFSISRSHAASISAIGASRRDLRSTSASRARSSGDTERACRSSSCSVADTALPPDKAGLILRSQRNA